MRHVVLALVCLAGCAQVKHKEPPPPPQQPVEPDTSLPPGHEWPAALKGARCGVVIAGHHESLEPAEELAFAVSFAEHLFAEGSPFVRDDGAAGPPPYVAAPRFTFRPSVYYAEGRPHLDMQVDAEAVIELRGGELARTSTVAHGLIGSLSKRAEQRQELARTLGRLAARKLLKDLAEPPPTPATAPPRR